MTKAGKTILLLATGSFAINTALAQDIHFSQFYETSILRNPSLTGLITADYKVGVLYRNQWSSISKPFQTAVLNAETRIPVNNVNDYLSIGMLGYYDKAGSVNLKSIGVYPAVNYNKAMGNANNAYLSVGFTGGYIQRSFDPSKATFNNQYLGNGFNASNPTGENFNNPSFSYWDLGAGITYSGSSGGEERPLNYIFGIAGYHFTRPRNSFFNNNNIRIAPRYNANVSISKQISDIWSFQLHANYAMQGSYNELVGGGMIGWNKKEANDAVLFVLFVGAYYRVKDAIIPTVRMRFKDLAVTCSYDVNASRLRTASNLQGGYEISVIKTGLINNPNREKSRTICPDFY